MLQKERREESGVGGDASFRIPAIKYLPLGLYVSDLFYFICFASKNGQKRGDLLGGVVAVFLRPSHSHRWPSAAPGDGFTGQDRRQDSGESGDSYHR